MTNLLAVKKPLVVSLLLLLGVNSNFNIELENSISGSGDTYNGSDASFWDDNLIHPSVDKYACFDSNQKFRKYKGNIGFGCVNSYKYVYTYNLNQSKLNSDFNKYHNSTRSNTYHYSWENLYNVGETCVEVAAADIVISHETDIGYSWKYDSAYSEAYYLFYNAVVSAFSSGYMKKISDDYYESTKTTKTDYILTQTLYQLYDKYYGKKDIVEETYKSSSGAYDKCKQLIDQNKPCLLSLKGHSVVCKGYEEYEFQWTEVVESPFKWLGVKGKEEKKYKKYRYLAIDLGWGAYMGSTVNTRGKYDTCSWICEDKLSFCTIVNLK